MYRSILNKKNGAIGETLTWVFATPIILGILISFIIISIFLFNVKAVSLGDVKTDFAEESSVLVAKTFIAHDIADDKNKEVIDNTLKEWNDEK
jgi:hypothetical protein